MTRALAVVIAAAWLSALSPAAAQSPPPGGEDGPAETSGKSKKRRKAKPPAPQPQVAVPAAPASSKSAAAPPQDAAKPLAAQPGGAPVSAASTTSPDLLPELADTTPPAKLALTSFEVEGDAPAALVYQLQDGFVLGLVRAGVRVIDVDDLKNRLKDEPDLLTCDTSPCLKRLGQHVGVRHVARVQVVVTGNSYRMSARIFRTTGAAPAAMPIETQSRFCDVCTVTEAREAMLRLADGIRVPDEPGLVEAKPVTPVVIAPSYRNAALAAMVVGAASIVVGTIVVAASGDGGKGLPVLGGGFMGAGAVTTVAGIFFYGDSIRKRPQPSSPNAAK